MKVPNMRSHCIRAYCRRRLWSHLAGLFAPFVIAAAAYGATFVSLGTAPKGTVVVAVGADPWSGPFLAHLAGKQRAWLERAMEMGGFNARKGGTLDLMLPALDRDIERLIIVGLGAREGISTRQLRLKGEEVAALLEKAKSGNVFLVPDISVGGDEKLTAAAAAMAAGLDPKGNAPAITVLVPSPSLAFEIYSHDLRVAAGIRAARDLIARTLDAGSLEPLVSTARALERDGIKVETLTVDDAKRAGLSAIPTMAGGLRGGSGVIVLQWTGGSPSEQPVALVGAAVIEEGTGGAERLSIEAAATVVAAVYSAAANRTRKNVVGVIPFVVTGKSVARQTPDAQLANASVKLKIADRTVELLGTTSRAGLITAEAMRFAIDRYRPRVLLDLGAFAPTTSHEMGSVYGFMISNQTDLAQALLKAGQVSGDLLWELPLFRPYRVNLQSTIADIRWSTATPDGINAALFLETFVGSTSWAHIDIGSKLSSQDRGYGTDLLDCYLTSCVTVR
jgi:leucyl aminopeptidase